MAQVGRNDPCPCGSGKKYKKCCLGQRADAQPPPPGGDPMADLREALKSQSFASMEEVQTFADKFMARKNRAPRNDFLGLSSEQMYHLLHHPFNTPWLVRFPDPLTIAPTAPVITLATLMMDAMGEKGLKLTQRGNLPRQFCRDAALACWGEKKYREETRYSGINKEVDFRDLHKTRLIMEMTDMLQTREGKMYLSPQCRDALNRNGLAGVYPKLLKTAATQFNWGYHDRMDELPIVQTSFAFILYLLVKKGETWRLNGEYEDMYLRAFPAAPNEASPDGYFSPEQEVRFAFTTRGLVRFAGFMGLAEIERTGEKTYRSEHRIRKTPLLEEAVKFQVSAE